MLIIDSKEKVRGRQTTDVTSYRTGILSEDYVQWKGD
jgi:hypothetical protein